jgi:cytochrome c2
MRSLKRGVGPPLHLEGSRRGVVPRLAGFHHEVRYVSAAGASTFDGSAWDNNSSHHLQSG